MFLNVQASFLKPQSTIFSLFKTKLMVPYAMGTKSVLSSSERLVQNKLWNIYTVMMFRNIMVYFFHTCPHKEHE